MSVQDAPTPLEALEIDLLLEAVYRLAGFDFRDYARSSVRRRIWNVVRAEQAFTIAGLVERVVHSPASLENLILGLSVSTTAMFRDPEFYLAFRRAVVPWLGTYPFVRIWIAGCSTGEEAYSTAILLQEEGLYERSRIYATDMSEAAVRKARAGVYALRAMQESTRNYLQAGGQRAFSDYYCAANEDATMDGALKKNLVFATHNLAVDASFNEFNVILCRNVLIYFNSTLQARVHDLLYHSLVPFGVLGLGDNETLRFTPHEQAYEPLDDRQKLFRRIGAWGDWTSEPQAAAQVSD